MFGFASTLRTQKRRPPLRSGRSECRIGSPHERQPSNCARPLLSGQARACLKTRSGAPFTSPAASLLLDVCLTYLRYAFTKVPCMERKFGKICCPRSIQTRPNAAELEENIPLTICETRSAKHSPRTVPVRSTDSRCCPPRSAPRARRRAAP